MSKDFDEEYWEERYRGHGAAHGRPNPQLLAEAADLAPGAALDAGCGEGADAAWLAARGWRVTAVDVSATALARARERADALGAEVAGRIDWVRADLTAWTPPEGRFDLVSTHYVHTVEPMERLLGRLAAAVAPGGTLLVVGHDHAEAHSAGPHRPVTGAHVTTAELAAGLDPGRWDLAVAETRSREAGHGGRTVTIHDAVLRARRRP
ncbi:class I SAM-dependent methyltransferase [Allonocardiopsis opalescens]|uniref:Methyltransferase family protein n=1 Tax=Allonocardiopsis opalescens TaxID=1144618 RepID=A0A2T0Q5L0_9ACTN|nr:class I SAM-dependent methyltransferase [Allonocardiopsis opalescens]PRX99069.1 methyltransferase family protein [Allonocardiopsis opalescens]